MTEEKRQEARKLMQQGVMRKVIAARLGVSPQAVSRACVGISSPAEHRGCHNRKKVSRFASFRWEASE